MYLRLSGYTHKQIAAQLGCSYKTSTFHMKSITHKLRAAYQPDTPVEALLLELAGVNLARFVSQLVVKKEVTHYD